MKIEITDADNYIRRGYSNSNCVITFEWGKDRPAGEGALIHEAWRCGVEDAMMAHLGKHAMWCNLRRKGNQSIINFGRDSGD